MTSPTETDSSGEAVRTPGPHERTGARAALVAFTLFVFAFVGVSTWEIIAAACFEDAPTASAAKASKACEAIVGEGLAALERKATGPTDAEVLRTCGDSIPGLDAAAAYARIHRTSLRIRTESRSLAEASDHARPTVPTQAHE
ncbi:MAG: hypothetical protein U0169_25440 [Polyangiaceae bacterium]